MKRILSILTLTLMCVGLQAQSFTHPGLLHTKQDIERMKAYVVSKEEPAFAAYKSLSDDNRAKADYKMAGPYKVIARDGKYRSTKGGSENDFAAAYYNALMWHITGNDAHAKKAVEIIRAYSGELESVDGHDAPLCALQGFLLVNACELMRDKLGDEGNNAAKAMLRRTFMPVLDKFEADSPYANGNWGAIANKMRMAVAIYCDDKDMYDAAKDYFLNAYDNGAVPRYISATGQCQETGRDQAHAQLGVGTLAETCEMAWNQGDDLYGALDNRLLKGYEYMAKYNLGWDVPFTTWTDCTGLYNEWTEPGQMGRGKLWSIYEIAYNHYVGRKGLQMPYVSMALGKGGVRPEMRKNGADHVGYGSLLFYKGTKVDHKSRIPGAKERPTLHQVVTWSAPEGAPLKKDYEVRVRARGGEWKTVDTYMAKVNAPVGNNKHRICEVSYGMFDFTGTVDVEVVCKNKKYKTVKVRPDFRGVIANAVNDSTVRFMLFQPEHVSVEFDGNITDNLMLFTSKPSKSVAEAKKEAKKAGRKFVYYAPGFHSIPNDTIFPEPHTTVYVDGGAYIQGTFHIKDVEDVHIMGRGIARPSRGYEGCKVSRSENVSIEGLTMCTCPVGESDNVTIRNAKVISHPSWGDGFNVFASHNVLYDRVFARTSDDCTTVYATRKGYNGSATNIRMQNSTLWADVAHPVMIGIHGNSQIMDTIVGVTYDNIDILCHSEPQIDYQGCLAINCGDNNLVKDITFDNIRIEDIHQGSLLHVKVCYNSKYCTAPGRGVENILFRNVRYNGKTPGYSIIGGYNEQRRVKNVRFEGLRINGTLISDDMPGKPGWYKTSDMCGFYVNDHVEGITFTK